MFMVCISNSSVLRAVEPIFLARESIGILSDLVANTGIALDIGLQVGVVLHKFAVVYERRILANLLGNFAVVVKEAIELLSVRTCDIAIPSVPRQSVLGAVKSDFRPA